MVKKVAALSNLVCRILMHRTSLPSYVIGLASLLLAGRVPQTKILLNLSLENQPPWRTQANNTWNHTQNLGGLDVSLGAHKIKEKYGQSHELLKSACLSNKKMQFQTKGGISDGVLTVTYYDSGGFVSCNFIFHVTDPTYGMSAWYIYIYIHWPL